MKVCIFYLLLLIMLVGCQNCAAIKSGSVLPFVSSDSSNRGSMRSPSPYEIREASEEELDSIEPVLIRYGIHFNRIGSDKIIVKDSLSVEYIYNLWVKAGDGAIIMDFTDTPPSEDRPEP